MPAPGRLRLRLAALGLAVLFVVECVLAERADAPTYDETTHLPQGYLHLVHGDYRFQVDHPPAAKMLAAAGALLAGVREPPPPPAWQADLGNRFQHRAWAWRFLYGTPGQDAERLVRAGRLAVVLAALPLLGVVWAWTRRLHGEAAALGALALASVDPNVVAHGHLVTADAPVAALTAAAAYLLWRTLVRRRASTAVALGGVLGLGLATKYTALLLVPLVALLLLARALDPAPWGFGHAHGRAARLRAAAALLVLVLATAWVVLWGAYRFRAAAAPGGAIELAPRAGAVWFAPRPAAVTAVVAAVERRLIPDAWGFGLLYLWADRRLTPRVAYLGGELSASGWWYYFPATLALKAPLATLGLAALGLATGASAVVRAARLGPGPAPPAPPAVATDPVERRWAWAVLAVVPATVLGAAVASPLQVGLRQVLPVYPFLVVAAGAGLARCLARRRPWGRMLAIAAVAWTAASSAAVAPRYLAYFNEAAGGPSGGVRWLVDSNLDWGQALRELPGWLARHGIPEVNLSYFGTADPDAYGFRYVALPGGTAYGRAPSSPRLPGYVAISATHLVGVHHPPELRAWYRALLAGARPVGVVGHAIHVYHVARPP